MHRFSLAYCVCLLFAELFFGCILPATNAALTFTVLHKFSDLDSSRHNSEGANPRGPLVEGRDGNFYGTTHDGGSTGNGTVFKISPSGTLTTLYTFSGFGDNTGTNYHVNSDGANPSGGLIQGHDGNFYGTTESGGSGSVGTVFKITPSGAFIVLTNFTDDSGYFPQGELIQASDGNFYGTKFAGRGMESGTVYRVSPSGELTTLVRFTGPNGKYPGAGLVEGIDGNFYGTTVGDSGIKIGVGPREKDWNHWYYGTVFKITPQGNLTTLHTFSPLRHHGHKVYGAYLHAALVLSPDGNFYGMAEGGPSGGILFKITPQGKLTTFPNLYLFYPRTALVMGRDGNFYSAVQDQVCRITPSGEMTSLYFSTDPTFEDSTTALMQGNDGALYGTVYGSDSALYGTVHSSDSNLYETNDRYNTGEVFKMTFGDTGAASTNAVPISPNAPN